MDSVNDVGLKDKGKTTGRVGVLDRSVSILSFLAEGGPATLAEVTKATGIPRPTVHRLLSSLETHRLVVRSRLGYSLGLRLLGWGNRAADTSLVEAARPVLERLRDVTDESVQLYVREGNYRVCVAAVERSAGLKDTVPVGSVLPLELGSAGKVLSAWSRDEGVPEPGGSKELEFVRQQGWAESIAEREEGVASVSAPVFGPDGALRAAICASGPISRLKSPGERLAEPLARAARDIETSLWAR